jgi:glycosyltransferase involved in cell wall biosynthesis
MNVCDFKAISDSETAGLPLVVYFHENQITYPCRVADERDYHYGLTNITSALAANSVWFNSDYHKKDFLREAKKILKKMPDYKCLDILEDIEEKSQTVTPCVTEAKSKLPSENGPLRIVWAARWEHDKNPEDFFAAVKLLRQKGADFRLSVTGQSFRDVPGVFALAREEFSQHIDHWGFLEEPRQYHRILEESDVFVSTAIHEFFGISAVEAAAAGCAVLVPQRLAYPEVFSEAADIFYDGTPENLANKLAKLARNRDNLAYSAKKCREISEKYLWKNNIDRMDDMLETACTERAVNY